MVIRRVLGGAVGGASALRIVALLLGVAGSVVVARLGGAEVKGVASAYAGINAVAFLLVNFDLPHQALRRGRAAGDLGEVSPLLARVWAMAALIGSVAAIVLLAVGLSDPAWVAVGTVTCLIGAQAAVAISGTDGPRVGAWGAVIQQGAIVLVAGLLGIAGALTGDTVKLAIVASYVLPMAYFARYLLRSGRHLPGPRLRSIGQLVVSGLPWQFARIPQVLLLKLDVIVAFAVLGAAAAGMYSIGLALAMLCTLVPAQFASHALHLASRGEVADPGRIVRQSLLAGAVAAFALAAAGAPAILLLYGDEFFPAYPAMLACLPGACAYGIMQVQTNLIRILGSARQLWTSNIAGLAVMLLGFSVLIPLFGTVGTGLAFSAGCVTTATVTALRRRALFPEQPARE